MSPGLAEIVLSFLQDYGLVAVFVLLVLDGAMLMPVLPGEVVMIMAVVQYAEGPSDLVMLVALATGAAILGSLMLYGIIRVGGRPLVEAHPRLFMMSRRRRERLERAFQRPIGQGLVLFLRLIPLTRVLVNIPAGLARMRLGRFLVLSSIGLIVFHAGFMWLAYEYRQPDSGVAQQAAVLQGAYASPAWEYVQANQVVAGLVVLGFGAILSFRGSVRVLRDPEEGSGSLIGWVAARVLFWGGLAIAVGAWLVPDLVIRGAAAGGLDIPNVAGQVGYEPVQLIAISAAVAYTVGLVLILLRGAAKRRQARWRQERAREELIAQVPAFEPNDAESAMEPEQARRGPSAPFDE